MHIFSVLEIWYWIINWWALPWERLFLPLSQLFLSCLEFLPRVEASLLLCGLVSSFFGPPIILNFLCLYKLLSPFSVAHMFMCLVLITWNWMTYHRAYVWENKSHTLSNQCPHIASHLGWGLVKFSPLLLDCQLLLSLLWFCLAFLKYIRIWRWSKWNCQIMGRSLLSPKNPVIGMGCIYSSCCLTCPSNSWDYCQGYWLNSRNRW